MNPIGRPPQHERIRRAIDRREPYVRVTRKDGTTVDRKATAWTPTRVLVKWYDYDKPSAVVAGVPVRMDYAWFPADRVQRIKRSESAWQDMYDPPGHE